MYADRELTGGRLEAGVVDVLKRIRDETNTGGFLVALCVLFVVIYVLTDGIVGYAGTALGEATVSLASIALAGAYTTWVGWRAYREYDDIARARAISQRPSVDTVREAFGLLTSTDTTVRELASDAIAEVVSLGPAKVVSEMRVDADELVSYLVPRLYDPSATTRSNIAVTIQQFARDYPAAVDSHRSELLDLLDDDQRNVDVRSHLAMSVGYLALSTDGKTERIETLAVELLDSSEPELRIGACYMLAGVGSSTARQKLKTAAQQDPDATVREHAGALT